MQFTEYSRSILTLSYKNRELEKKYDEYFSRKFLIQARVAYLLGIFLYTVFLVLDYLIMPSDFSTQFVIRVFVISPLVLIMFFLTYTRLYTSYMHFFGLLIAAFGHFAMGIFSNTPPAYVMGTTALAITFAHVFAGLRFKQSFFYSLVVLAFYEIVEVVFTGCSSLQLIYNNFILLSINSIGTLASYTIDRLEGQSFIKNLIISNKNYDIIKSEETYRAIFETTSNPTIIIEKDNTIILANREFARFTGLQKDEIEGKRKWTEFVLPDDLEIMQRYHNERKEPGVDTPKNYEFRMSDGAGTIRTISLSVDIIPETERSIASLLDITERKRAEDELRDSEEKYRSILENINEAYFEVDLKGIATFFNDSMCSLIGYTREEGIGRSYAHFMEPESVEEIFSLFNTIYSTGQPSEIFDWRFVQKNSEVRIAQGTASLIIDAAGNKCGFRGILRDITDLKEAQDALVISEDKYSTILKTISEGYFEVDLMGSFTFVNDAMCEILGRTMEEMIGLHYVDYMTPECAEKGLITYDENILAIDKTGYFEWEIIGPDGDLRYLSVSLNVKVDENNVGTGFRGMARDITAAKKSEHALRESEEKYRTILENIEDGYCEADLNGIILHCNDSFAAMLGRTVGEITSTNYSQYTDSKNAAHIYNHYNSVYTTGKPSGVFDYSIIRKDGSCRNVEAIVSLITDQHGSKTGFRGIFRDVTEKKHAEEALRESEEKYRGILENMNDTYFEVDLDGNFIFFNDRLCELFGYSRDEIMNTSFRNYQTEKTAEKVFKVYNSIFKGKKERGLIEYEVINRNNEIKTVETSVNLIKDSEGKAIGFRGVGRDITERKESEEALRESEERYRHILDNASDIIFINDYRGIIKYVNTVGERMLGYDRGELIGKNYGMVLPDDYKDSVMAFYGNQYIEKIGNTYNEIPLMSKDGKVFWAGQFVKMVQTKDGQPEFHGVARDITARKEAEEALRESEKRHRMVLDNVEDGVFICGDDGILTYCNKASERITGYSSDEIVGRNYLHFIHKDDRKKALETSIRQLNENIDTAHYGYRFLTKDGRSNWISQTTRMVKNKYGKIEFYSTARDETEKKMAEQALFESEKKYRSIIENINDGYFELDLQGNIVFANEAMTEISGFSMEEGIGLNFKEFLTEDSQLRAVEVFSRIYTEKLTNELFDYEIIRGDGKKIWLSSSTSIIIDDTGNPTGFRGIARDITKKVEAEEARRELEEQKSRFFANVSHEIRTPLTLMLSPIESYLQGDYIQEINRSFFDNLYRNGIKLLKLINNLLDFSKIEAGRMTMKVVELDIVTFIQNYVASLQSACDSRGVLLAFMPPKKVANLYGDPEKIDKIFMNLLSNALKFTGESGTIAVRLREDDVFCYIEFEDTGQGIPADSLDKIFERFGQADTSSSRQKIGTGIGLALARELVEMHGGTITVQSRYIEDHPDDHGSVFTITLLKGKEHLEEQPNISFGEASELDDAVSDHRYYGMREMDDICGKGTSEETDLTGAGPHEDSSAATHSILIVDDNSDMRDFLTALLGTEYTVINAENGRRGLDVIEEHSPDLVITDVMMPVMDGYEMTRLIRENDKMKSTPVIMLTAKAEISQKIEGLEFGADDYLTKPFNSKELLTRVKTLLKTREYEKAMAQRNYEIEQEMEVARQLQHRLLPERIEELAGYDSHAVYIPMDKVGGDFYDYVRRDQFIDFFIADVSGHGLPGAFLAMMTKMALESVRDRGHTGKTLAIVNNVIHRSTVNENYVTAFLCTIDTGSNIMKFSNAGHFPPLVFRKKSAEFFELKAKGLPMGWFDDITLDEKEFQLLPGDRLILFTDGITESISPEGELFGDERFRDFIAANSTLSPAEFSTSLITHLKVFSQSENFDDDLTIVIFDVL